MIPPCGRVGEWLKPADCKSAAPCGLRRFESSPVHHLIASAGEALKHGRSVFFFVSKLGRAVKSDGAALFAYQCDGCELYYLAPAGKKLRCMRQTKLAWVAQLVERVLGKDEVTSSILVPGSRRCLKRQTGRG